VNTQGLKSRNIILSDVQHFNAKSLHALPEPAVLEAAVVAHALHVVSDLNVEPRLVRKLRTVLRQDLGTAGQTARWIARSATGFEVASNVAGVVNAEIEIGVVRRDSHWSLLGQRRPERPQAGHSQSRH